MNIGRGRSKGKEGLPIDGKKLKNLIYGRGESYTSIGAKFGFTDNWMSNYVNRNEILPYAVTLLETIGINYDEYRIVEDVSEAETEQKANEKAPCHYCSGDMVPVANVVDGKFNVSAVICARRKTIMFGCGIGNEEIASDTFFVNYCPCCGRKL
jgi:hypothetical protein